MLWRRLDRALILGAGATLAAIFIVGWLTPRWPGDNMGCGMDARYYLGSTSLGFLLIRSTWPLLKAGNDRIKGWLPARTDLRSNLTPCPTEKLRP